MDRDLDDLRAKMDEAISRMASKEIRVSPETIKDFCGIVKEANPVYFDLQEAKRAGFEKIPIPESYLLTLRRQERLASSGSRFLNPIC